MKKKITIVGGGAAALLLGCELDSDKFEITIYEKNAALGRKFLVAGEGGLNLSHSENETNFLTRYNPSALLENAFFHFSNKHFTSWINSLGIETYVGSSGRIFPVQGIKPIEVLNRITDKIKKNKVEIYTHHCWKGFSERGALVFEDKKAIKEVDSDFVIFCLGGASWPVTGSTGDWDSFFSRRGVLVNPFQASNCAFKIGWLASILPKVEGKILKNTAITCANKKHIGEITLTRFGMEGSGIYPLSPQIREELKNQHVATIYLDFKPAFSLEKLIEKIKTKQAGKNITEHLRSELRLSDAQLTLVKHGLSKEQYLDADTLAQSIKKLPLSITQVGAVEDAISTTGGIALQEIDVHFQLKKIPNHFTIGEMLDYDAPTGGYLLQSCFSMAKYLADFLNTQNTGK